VNDIEQERERASQLAMARVPNCSAEFAISPFRLATSAQDKQKYGPNHSNDVFKTYPKKAKEDRTNLFSLYRNAQNLLSAKRLINNLRRMSSKIFAAFNNFIQEFLFFHF